MADFNKKTGIIEIEIDTAKAEKNVDNLSRAIVSQKKVISENTKEIKGLEKANKDLQKEVDKGNVSQDKANKTISDNEKKIKALSVSTLKEKDQLKDLNRERRDAVKQTKLQSNSLDALRAESVKLKKQFNAQETATAEGRKEFNRLKKELKETNDSIKELDQGAGDFKTSVGDYPKVLELARGQFDKLTGAVGANFKSTSSASSATSSMTKNTGMLSKAVTGSIGAVNALTAASLRFIATPVGFVLGVIAAAFAAVTAAMARNQEYMDRLTKAFKPLEAVVDTFLGALEPLAELLVEGIEKGLNAAAGAIDLFTTAVANGLEFLGFDEAAESVRNFQKQVEKNAEAAVAIFEMEKAYIRLNRALKTVSESLEGQIALTQQMADDDTISFEQQQKAANAVIALQTQLFNKRLEVAKLAEDRAKREVELAEQNNRLNDEVLDAAAEATAARMQLDNEYTLFLAENATRQRKIEQDLWEQRLDFAIDIGTKRMEEILKQAENEKISIEDRNKLLEEAAALEAKNFENQTALFEEAGLTRLKINELIKESNADVIASELEKTELSEKERDRFRDLLLVRSNNVQAIKDAEQGLLDFEEKAAEERIKKQEELNKRMFDTETKNIESQHKLRLLNAQNAQEALDELDRQARADFDRKIDRLEKERQELIDKGFESAEEEAAAQAEIDAEKLEAKVAYEEQVTNIELQQLRLRERQRKEHEDAVREIEQVSQELAFEILNAQSTRVEKEYNDRYKELEKQLNAGLISEEQFAAEVEKIEQEKALKLWEIETKRFNLQKALDIINITKDTAAAVMKAASMAPLPFGLPLIALNTALGAAQLATVVQQQPPPKPTFAEGGDVTSVLVGGRRHSQGGTKYYGQDGNAFEVESGEGIFVTKREATNPALALLNRTNTSFGGASMFASGSRFLQEGGAASMGGSAISAEDLAEAMAQVPAPVVQVQSIMAGINAEVSATSVGII